MTDKNNSKVYSVLLKCTDTVQEAYGPVRQRNDHFAIWVHEDWMQESTVEAQAKAELESGFYPLKNIEIVKIVNLPKSNRIRKYERRILGNMMSGICPNG